jgi:uncharacterized protein
MDLGENARRPPRRAARCAAVCQIHLPGGNGPLAYPTKEDTMGFDQYHEPAGELSAETRTFARMIASLTEEAEAIGWYEQRMSVEADKDARAIMENAQSEEFKHFAMDLEFLTRRTEKWRIALKTTLFTDGDIVEAGERAEEAEGLG